MFKTIEEFDVEQARERELFLAELFLAELAVVNGLPRKPRHISNLESGVPWASYEVSTLEEAVELMALFGERRTIYCATNACTSVSPLEFMSEDYANVTPRWWVPNGFEIRQHVGRGFASFALQFWPVSSKVFVSIAIRNFPYQMRGQIRAAYNEHGDVARVEKTPPQFSSAEQSISFGRGSRDTADWRRYFSDADSLIKMEEAA